MASRQVPPKPRRTPPAGRAATAPSALTLQRNVLAAVIIGVILLAGVFVITHRGARSAGPAAAAGPAYQVGRPGPGQLAPPVQLPSTRGGTFSLASLRGQTVLLYFQEGLTCQPCWDQLKDLEGHQTQLRALGITQMASITTDPLDQLRQKASDEGLHTAVLSDPNLTVSSAYNANRYGMMGTSRDGHTFILVGPSGRILWRADYGGAPNYTMYVPVNQLLQAMRTGLRADHA